MIAAHQSFLHVAAQGHSDQVDHGHLLAGLKGLPPVGMRRLELSGAGVGRPESQAQRARPQPSRRSAQHIVDEVGPSYDAAGIDPAANSPRRLCARMLLESKADLTASLAQGKEP